MLIATSIPYIFIGYYSFSFSNISLYLSLKIPSRGVMQQVFWHIICITIALIKSNADYQNNWLIGPAFSSL